MRARYLALSLVFVSTASACSSIHYTYVQPGYDSAADDATKNIIVTGWAPSERTELASLTARLAADRIKLKKNYLVHDAVASSSGWSTHCNDEIQGVLAARILQAVNSGTSVELSIEVSLYRCTDGALLWRGVATGAKESQDDELAAFVEGYVREYPREAPAMTLPLFIHLVELLDNLPDVVLTEDEEITKIELS